MAKVGLKTRPNRFRRFWLILCGGLFPGLHAETPPLLAKAFAQWAGGRGDLAFTQQTRFFFEDGRVKAERIERFDPSLPESSRWRLIEIDGRPATDEQRKKWEAKKNRKARKKVVRPPADYVDLEHAVLLEDSPKDARYEIRLRPDAARLLGVQKIAALVTVDKESGSIVRITAALHEPVRVLMGLARITDLDIDVNIEPGEEDSTPKAGEVATDSTASVSISELGNPMEYNWSDFKRVMTYGGAQKPG
jgi:hypothetical protein